MKNLKHFKTVTVVLYTEDAAPDQIAEGLSAVAKAIAMNLDGALDDGTVVGVVMERTGAPPLYLVQ